MRIPRRMRFANLPTPLEYSEGLSKMLPGKKVWIKRDDMTGVSLTGNKVRKLEFLSVEAQNDKCTCLITCGGIQSNHARATAIIAAKLGMNSFLVLRKPGDSPEEIQGNLLLDKILDSRIKFISPQDYKHRRHEIMEEVRDLLEEQGEKGYIIPEGGSNALGSMGYVEAVCEIKSQLEEKDITIDTVVTPMGSGGTYAGLLVGAKYYGWNAKIIGVNVCDNEEYFRNKVKEITSEMISKFKIEIEIEDRDINILDGYVGLGYAKSQKVERDLLCDIARSTGLFLDPVYTCKTFLGLKEEIRKGTLEDVEKILFLHTGGIFGLFSFNKLFSNEEN